MFIGLAAVAPAHADRPGPEFKRLADETSTSPDRQLRIEQYLTEREDVPPDFAKYNAKTLKRRDQASR